jgi:leader peptidase (prepilin peptidase) / N-methyltransferase
VSVGLRAYYTKNIAWRYRSSQTRGVRCLPRIPQRRGTLYLRARLWQIEGVIAAVVFLFGLIVGSFLNVCILRLPAGESIAHPPSRCPACSTRIRPYDNIPVLSYLLLRGKCRQCGARVSPQYPLVELLAALLFLACYRSFGLSVDALKWTAFCAVIIVLVFVDLRERMLPDVVNFTGVALGLAFSLFTAPADGTALRLANRLFESPPPAPILSIADALIGATVGSGLLWLISEGYFRLRHREGLGLGDVKMMLMAGTFLGFWRTLLTILGGSLLGAVLGGAFMLFRRKSSDYELPFGLFLGIAAVLAAFFGGPIVEWYQSQLTVR